MDPATIITVISAADAVIKGAINLARVLHAKGDLTADQLNEIAARGRASDKLYNDFIESLKKPQDPQLQLFGDPQPDSPS